MLADDDDRTAARRATRVADVDDRTASVHDDRTASVQLADLLRQLEEARAQVRARDTRLDELRSQRASQQREINSLRQLKLSGQSEDSGETPSLAGATGVAASNMATGQAGPKDAASRESIAVGQADSRAEAFTVVTYNILSPALASPDWFTSCDPANLEPETRFARVAQKLGIEINKRACICLQEVSRDWSGKLHALFQQNQYTMIDSLYGMAVSGYMGVALAFPNERWTAVDVDIRRIADTKEYWHVEREYGPRREHKWRPTTEVRAGDWTCPACGANVFAGKTACFRCHAPKPEPAPDPEPLAAGPLDGLLSLWTWLSARCGGSALARSDSASSAGVATPVPASASAPAPAAAPAPAPAAASAAPASAASAATGSQAEAPPWYEAARRKENTMVAVHLRSTTHPQLTLWCGTYHMPCAFEQPKLMAMHAALAMQHLQRLAAPTSAPCALGGDWNLKPPDAAYALLTTAKMDPALSSDYPTVPEGDAWSPTLRCPMRSAYRVAHGHEPDFTNYAQTTRDASPFIGCLDYVFCSPHLRVLGAPPLPRREDYIGAAGLRSTRTGPLPTASEPSDHLLLSVELELPSTPDPAHAGAYGAAPPAPPASLPATARAAASKPARGEANARLEAARRAELEAFLGRSGETVLSYPSSLNSYERRVVHAIAEELGLKHTSQGEGRNRFIRIEKVLQPFGGEGHRLVSSEGEHEGPKLDATSEDMRAARLAALERRQQP